MYGQLWNPNMIQYWFVKKIMEDILPLPHLIPWVTPSQQLLGQLIYIMVTHLDIIYVFCVLSQYLQEPH